MSTPFNTSGNVIDVHSSCRGQLSRLKLSVGIWESGTLAMCQARKEREVGEKGGLSGKGTVDRGA